MSAHESWCDGHNCAGCAPDANGILPENQGSQRGAHVYVLCFGEYSEGHSPISAHSTLEGAAAAASKRAGRAFTFEQEAGDDDPELSWMASHGAVDEFWIYRLAVTP